MRWIVCTIILLSLAIQPVFGLNGQSYDGMLLNFYKPQLMLAHISHYCPCKQCCGKTDKVTASGVIATPGHTIAMSRSIPFFTNVIIDGITYVVEDRGGAIGPGRIDIYCNTHEEALALGIMERMVIIDTK